MSQAYFSHGQVGHVRLGIRENSFKYPIFNFLFRCQDEEAVVEEFQSRFWRFLTLRGKDYLSGETDSFELGVRNFLNRHCQYDAEEVWLQTMPRMFGYGFNPVSFWFCKKAGQLDAVLAEVNNTFGERHFYWLHVPGQAIVANEWLRAKKVFHVSPFYPVDGYYEFRFQLSEQKSRVDINYFSDTGKVRLVTWIEGRFLALEEQSLMGLLWRYGWMTPAVILRIHWQALILWRKRVAFFSKPAPPSKEVT